MSWFARLRERVFAPPYKADYFTTGAGRRFHGKVMAHRVPPELLQKPTGSGYRLHRLPPDSPVIEIMPWSEAGPTDDVVGVPIMADWLRIVPHLWPRPDPSKRWRLFIQEDTRP